MLALAAVYRGIGFREAHLESYYKSPEVLSLRERIEIRAREDWPRRGDERYRGLVTVTTIDGKKIHMKPRQELADEGLGI